MPSAPIVAHQMGSQDALHWPKRQDSAEPSLPHGRARAYRREFVFERAAASTLRTLAAQGARCFSGREITEGVAAFSKETGGAMTLRENHNGYHPEWVTPIAKHYRGYDVHEIPPNGQGIAALIALGILGKFDLAGALPVNSVDFQHLQIEAMKLAFADIYRYVADPHLDRGRPPEMLDDAYLAEPCQADRHEARAENPRLRHAPRRAARSI